jgi:hypothetical protein
MRGCLKRVQPLFFILVFKSKISEGYHIFEILFLVALVDCQPVINFRHDNTKKNIFQILQSQTGYAAAS